jgi:hypothetical protein
MATVGKKVNGRTPNLSVADDALDIPLDELPTPTSLGGMKVARNWWGITPGYRCLVAGKRPASRRYVARRFRARDEDLARLVEDLQRRLSNIERQLANRGARRG